MYVVMLTPPRSGWGMQLQVVERSWQQPAGHAKAIAAVMRAGKSALDFPCILHGLHAGL
jgi:hypothetical protein